MITNFYNSTIQFTLNIMNYLGQIKFLKDFESNFDLNISTNFLIFSAILYVIIYKLHNINMNYNKILTIYIATPIHELFHLIGALITSAKIHSVKLIASKEERETWILGYVKSGPPFSNSLPLGILFWNLWIVTTFLRFIFQPIISLAPILFGWITYLFFIHIIFWIDFININQLEFTIFNNQISLFQSLAIFVSTILFLLISVPSYWENWYGDVNSVKYQLSIFIISSIFIKNDLFYSFTKLIYFYLILVLILNILFLIFNLLKSKIFKN